MGGWVSYVVEEKIYVVEVVCKYECIRWDHFGVFCDNLVCVKLCFDNIGVSR